MVGGRQETLQKLLEDLVLSHNEGHRFDSVLYWRDNFRELLRRLLMARQVLIAKKDDKIVGFIAWACVDNVIGLNKLRWELPDVVTVGKKFYVPICVSENPRVLLLFRKKLIEMGYRNRVKELCWNNSVRNKPFIKRIWRQK